MSEMFEAAARGLWERLGIGTPRFVDGVATLSVEGLAIALEESPDGRRILISGSPGRLAAEPTRAAEQVERLLRTGLGFLVGNRAGLFVDTAGAGANAAGTVRVQAAYDYDARSLERLMGLIDDVIQLVEFHAADLAGRAVAPSRPAPAAADISYEPVIFRP